MHNKIFASLKNNIINSVSDHMKITNLRPEHLTSYSEGLASFDWISYGPGTSPSTYLEFARKDFEESDGERSLINSVGNAKRAFHKSVETLCENLGLGIINKKNIISFDTKLRHIAKCGILSARILSRLNKTRNKVEHDYYTPSPTEVEDYLDIVELFLFAMDRALERFPTEIEFELINCDNQNNKHNLPINFKFQINLKSMDFWLTHNNDTIEKKLSDPDYFTWLKSIYSVYFT